MSHASIHQLQHYQQCSITKISSAHESSEIKAILSRRKLTYGNVEFQKKFRGGPRTPASRLGEGILCPWAPEINSIPGPMLYPSTPLIRAAPLSPEAWFLAQNTPTNVWRPGSARTRLGV